MKLLADGGASLLKYEPVISTAQSSLSQSVRFSDFRYEHTVFKPYVTMTPKKKMTDVSLISVFLITIFVILLVIGIFQKK